MLAVISPWNGVVFWLDPAGAENDIPEFAQRTIINERIIKFSLVYQNDIKKMTKNPTIKWKKPECPRQSQESLDFGYYICRYILETIEKRRQVIPDKYFGGVTTEFPQNKFDELTDLWIKYVEEYKPAEEEESEESVDFN
ncbi:uncharacterized protein LOC104884252 [Beta vulgaris subsp. vulgaris]|uniref:uncharacterized protein LOC104884252 n=1 Tax=Beta vulgaris subsp. vulgaris TaxID=3555 RepID=UPI00053F79AC|nr:uncharacterized protein LOC104884252 [Beta vulgaris subsp. vulgaris]XP_048502065.1 uncharacterized protein LOC104884252 [Beta vulgaris subsp. vulgaris]XP_048502070.1 uncharacterized protein LOC104884252 [Beta vulgaris subsp. vulgaris]XP_057248423.1 uncharacterized protein LOC104884252 [Beta vulgaris subsp. vulgaris]XP_057248425.1 uncharacterized protein LOC104884252 [Beta vulgaris subsp. vulgaris]